MIQAKALKIAQYDFVAKDEKRVITSKLIVSLGEFGTHSLCTALANDKEVGSVFTVVCEYQKNKLVITKIK